MKITVNNKTYRVNWEYPANKRRRLENGEENKGKERPYFYNARKRKQLAGVTNCIIWSEGSIVGRGTSKVHPEDEFCKKEGRIKSLSNALEDLQLELSLTIDGKKEMRAEFWRTYSKVTNDFEFPGIRQRGPVEVMQIAEPAH